MFREPGGDGQLTGEERLLLVNMYSTYRTCSCIWPIMPIPIGVYKKNKLKLGNIALNSRLGYNKKKYYCS
jgi:hypothetical protein